MRLSAGFFAIFIFLFASAVSFASPAIQAVAAPAEKAVPALPGEWNGNIRYRVELNIKEEQWNVWMGVQLENPVPFKFWIPRWTPGGYHLAEFGKFLDDIEVTDEKGNPLKFQEVESPRHWEIDPGTNKRVIIHYIMNHSSPPKSMDLNNLEMEANRITKRYAFINSTSLFGFVEGMLDRPTDVHVELPEKWKVATALKKADKGHFTAENYYRLEDSPFLLSPKLVVETFEVDGIRHEVACHGKQEADVKTMAEQCKKIVIAGKRWMGRLPYDRYVFLLGFTNDTGMGAGGLEHSFSTLILMPSMNLDDSVTHVLAHEYFHLWNAERIQVNELVRPDYTKPLGTGTIWLNEGATEYMAFFLLKDAGLISENEFYAQMAGKNAGINSMSKISKKYSIPEVSKRWSSKNLGGMQGLMEIQFGVYERGSVCSFALDLYLREKTKGAKGLVHVFRYIMDEFVANGKGYPEDGLVEVIKNATGVDTSDFYNKYINGKELPDLDEFLAPIGLKMNRSARGGPAEGGFNDLDEITDAQKQLRAQFFTAPAASASAASDRPASRPAK